MNRKKCGKPCDSCSGARGRRGRSAAARRQTAEERACLKNPEKTWKKLLTNREGSGIVSKLSETRRSCQRESKKVFNKVKKVLDKLW